MKFLTPDLSDSRIRYAKQYLESKDFISVDKEENADFILLGVNPKFYQYEKTVFAGNLEGKRIIDYTKNEGFSIKNSYLTAEAALSIAINKSALSLTDSDVLILGYGRIGKALEKYLKPIAKSVTVCARDENARIDAKYSGSNAIDFGSLRHSLNYDVIFNTVPHPVLNSKELSNVKENALIIDLASFPGGADSHYARIKGINLIEARGLPGKYSPASAGKIVGETIINLLKEVKA